MYNKKRHSEKIQMKKTYVSLCLSYHFYMQQRILSGALFEAMAGWRMGDTGLCMQEDLIDCAASLMWSWIQRTAKIIIIKDFKNTSPD